MKRTPQEIQHEIDALEKSWDDADDKGRNTYEITKKLEALRQELQSAISEAPSSEGQLPPAA